MAAPVLHLVHEPRFEPSGEARAPARLVAPIAGLLELSAPFATGRTSIATTLVRDAQEQGELCAWVMRDRVALHVPDLVRAGIDLRALLFARLPAAQPASALVRAAELLLRSGAFGLVVLDLIDGVPRGAPAAWQGRLLALAREHGARVVLLSASAEHAESLGPLVSLRVAPSRTRVERGYRIDLRLLKDKAARFERFASPSHRGPEGLR